MSVRDIASQSSVVFKHELEPAQGSSDEIISFWHPDRHTHTEDKTYTSSLRGL